MEAPAIAPAARQGLMRRVLLLAALVLAACSPMSSEAQRAFAGCQNVNIAAETQAGHCTQYLELDTDPKRRAEALHRRAFIWQQMERWDAALADYDASIALDDTVAATFGNRGRLHAGQGRHQAAVADFAAAVRIAPQWTDPLMWSAMVRDENLGDYDGAIEDLSAALALRPDDPALLNNRCWVRAKARRSLDIALADCDRSLALIPGSPATLDSRGLVHLQAGRFDLAFADFDAAVRANPQGAHSLYGRGIAAQRLGRAEEGAGDIASAVAQDPSLSAHYAAYGFAQ